MSITKCRECGERVSSEAEKCPSCGIKNPSKLKHFFNSALEMTGGIIIIIVIIAVANRYIEPSSNAKCNLLERSLFADIFIINGEPDAGYRYNAKIQNNGEPGKIDITVKLSTSEGEFERRQSLIFDSQEIRNISYAFHEPTINSSNIQAHILCRP